MDVAENRAPEWVLKSLWIVAIIFCLCMDTRATGMDGQTGILAGLDRANKRKRGPEKSHNRIAAPSIGHVRRDHSQHRVTGRCLVACQGIPAEQS